MVGAHDPREWGYKATCQHATTIPGFWPDESRQHGEAVFLVFQSATGFHCLCHVAYQFVHRSNIRYIKSSFHRPAFNPPPGEQPLEADVCEQRLEGKQSRATGTRWKHCQVVFLPTIIFTLK